MGGNSPIVTSDEQRVALSALAGSGDRGEADRARAVLLTLSGWSSSQIAEAFGVREDRVRLWRGDFGRGGVTALKASIAPGAAAGDQRYSVARGHAFARRACCRQAELDDRRPARRDRSARGCSHQPVAIIQGVAKKRSAGGGPGTR
jgi:hypothetical protein